MPADQTNAREQAATALTKLRPNAGGGYDLIWEDALEFVDALLALGWCPAEAPVAPTREALLEILNSSQHAPLSSHDPRDGGCLDCPWPLYAMPPEEIADAILATPNLFQSRAEVMAEALEAAADELPLKAPFGFAKQAIWLKERAAAIRSGATK